MEELQFIADLCKRYNVICISDEVYEWLVYNGMQHIRIGKELIPFKLERAHNYLFYWVVILSFLPSSKLVPWFSLSFFPFGGKAHDIYLMTRLRGPAVFFIMYSIINSSLYKLWDTSHRIPKLRIVSGYHAVYLSLVTKYWKTCLDLRINICF